MILNGKHQNGYNEPEGGHGGSASKSLLPRRRDVNMLMACVSDGWEMTPQVMKKYREALDTALDKAIADDHPRNVNAIIKTAATIVAQVQADQHLNLKYARIDGNLGTEQVILDDATTGRLDRMGQLIDRGE